MNQDFPRRVHILIVTWWGLKDSLRGVARSLKERGHSVTEYPLSRFQSTNSDLYTPHWLWHFNEVLEACDPDVVLWWHLSIPVEPLRLLCLYLHAHRLHVFYNWDDPFAWSDKDLDLQSKVPCMHLAGISSADDASFELYRRKLRIKNGVVTLLPGYDHLLTDHTEPSEEIDVLAICSNDYADTKKYPDQWVVRSELLAALNETSDMVTHLYGPASFQQKYPNIYKGWMAFSQIPKFVPHAKCTLNTHVQFNAKQYLNERVPLIMGHRGLMICDPVKEMQQVLGTKGYCCFSSRNPKKCVDELRRLVQLSSRERQEIREEAHAFARQHLTWSEWALRLTDFLQPYLFSGTRARRMTYLRLELQQMETCEFHVERLPARNLSGLLDLPEEQRQHWTQFVQYSEALSEVQKTSEFTRMQEVGVSLTAEQWMRCLHSR